MFEVLLWFCLFLLTRATHASAVYHLLIKRLDGYLKNKQQLSSTADATRSTPNIEMVKKVNLYEKAEVQGGGTKYSYKGKHSERDRKQSDIKETSRQTREPDSRTHSKESRPTHTNSRKKDFLDRKINYIQHVRHITPVRQGYSSTLPRAKIKKQHSEQIDPSSGRHLNNPMKEKGNSLTDIIRDGKNGQNFRQKNNHSKLSSNKESPLSPRRGVSAFAGEKSILASRKKSVDVADEDLSRTLGIYGENESSKENGTVSSNAPLSGKKRQQLLKQRTMDEQRSNNAISGSPNVSGEY